MVYNADVQQLEEGTAVASHGTASRCAGARPEEHSYRVDPLAALQERELSLGAREADLLALEQLVARAAGRDAEWLAAREAELDRREGDLHRREGALNRVRASLTYAPASADAKPSRALDRPGTEELDEREADWWVKQLGPCFMESPEDGLVSA